jgi:mono/diheme cytochrome c family protein
MKIVLTILGTLVGLVIIAGVYIWSGAFSIAATKQHTPVVRDLFVSIRNWEIHRHGKDIAAPSLSDPARVQAGAKIYDSTCLMCHGGPGRERNDIGQGLNPEPPKLHSDMVQSYSNGDLYWIIKHGIKMTGMPAFGPTHDDEKLWNIVAFVRRLPEIKPEEYRDMVETMAASASQSQQAESPQRHGQ